MHSQQFGRRTARRLLSLALAGLFLAFAAAAAGAETVYDETRNPRPRRCGAS